MANTFLFADVATTNLASAITNTSTTIAVTTGTGAAFPQPGANQQFALILNSASGGSAYEIVYVTSVTGDTFTVLRGQEGTAAQNWNVGDIAFSGNTAGQMAAMAQLTKANTWSALQTFSSGLSGNLTGSVTGNVTGNVSGSSGSCTGNSATATTATTALNCSGNSASATTAASCSGNAATASAISNMPADTIVGNNSAGTASSSNLNGQAVAGILGQNFTNGTNEIGCTIGMSNIGAVILNCGAVTVSANGTANVTYPVGYNTFSVVTPGMVSNGSPANPLIITASSNSGFTVKNQTGSSVTANWIAMGI